MMFLADVLDPADVLPAAMFVAEDVAGLIGIATQGTEEARVGSWRFLPLADAAPVANAHATQPAASVVAVPVAASTLNNGTLLQEAQQATLAAPVQAEKPMRGYEDPEGELESYRRVSRGNS